MGKVHEGLPSAHIFFYSVSARKNSWILIFLIRWGGEHVGFWGLTCLCLTICCGGLAGRGRGEVAASALVPAFPPPLGGLGGSAYFARASDCWWPCLSCCSWANMLASGVSVGWSLPCVLDCPLVRHVSSPCMLAAQLPSHANEFSNQRGKGLKFSAQCQPGCSGRCFGHPHLLFHQKHNFYATI